MKNNASMDEVIAFCDGSCLDNLENEHYCYKECEFQSKWKDYSRKVEEQSYLIRFKSTDPDEKGKIKEVTVKTFDKAVKFFKDILNAGAKCCELKTID